jgi:MFS family permease
MMLIALLITIVGSILCAASTTMEMLIAARTLQGLGGGGLITLSHALIAQSVPPRDRVRFHGYISAIGFGASAMGPVVGGFLTAQFGWPWSSSSTCRCPRRGHAGLSPPGPDDPFEPFRFDRRAGSLRELHLALLILVEEVRQPLSARAWFAIALSLVVLLSLVLLDGRGVGIEPSSAVADEEPDRLALQRHGDLSRRLFRLLLPSPIYLRVVRDRPSSRSAS